MQRDWLSVMKMVRENRIDIGLASIAHAAMDPAFKTELLKEVRVHFICRAGHPLDNGRDPTMDDLRLENDAAGHGLQNGAPDTV